MWQAIKSKYDVRTTIFGVLIIFAWVGLSLAYENSSDSGVAGRRYVYQSKDIENLIGSPQRHILLGADFKRYKLSQCGYLRYLIFGNAGSHTFSIRITKYDDDEWVVKEVKDGLYPVFENTCFQ